MPDTVLASKQSVAFGLDGVAIKLETSFLPGESFVIAEPGDVLQAAAWATLTPASELTVTAVPFGTRPPMESVPAAASGLEKEYYAGFDKAREDGKVRILAQTDAGPAIKVFGKRVVGKALLASAQLQGRGTTTPLLTVEWVAQGGERLWVVRATQELAPGIKTLEPVEALLTALADIVLSSDTLDQPTTLSVQAEEGSPPATPPVSPGPALAAAGAGEPVMAAAATGNLPVPPWWNGVCNIVNYKKDVGRDSFPLPSNGFRGVIPCGPKPGPTGDRVVFFPDADGDFRPGKHGHGEFEFQCVELCMRFMQLAYGITAYPGNGSQVVSNFLTKSKMKDRNKMVVIQNGQFPPAPMPGDILSYGPVTTVGHTSVCIANNVDSNGNGTITVMEQNFHPSGQRVLPVQRWQVLSSIPVTSFLHPKDVPGPPLDPLFFPETGQFVAGGFKTLWLKPGNGMFLCGFPLTGEQAEGDLTVQYFENVRMEFRAGIQPRFGGVGRMFVEHPNSNVPPGVDPTGSGTKRFNETGHSIGGDFLALFNRYGLEVCGFPITGEINENGLTVQYFENVRMERSPALPARFGAVGRRFLELP